MAAAIPILTVVSGVVSAMSALRQGEISSAASTYNATISTENAAIARQNAADQAKQAERERYLRFGAIKAAQGHSGGDAGQGSVLDVLGDVAAQSELQKQDILYRGELAARGYTNTANLDRASASNQESSGWMKAGTELLSGAAGAYSLNNRLSRA
jgi:hypothetical protein